MRRLVLLLALASAGATGLWLALRGGDSAHARVTSLLPRETVAFVHVPDFNRAREQWRQTDIYKLWREPAVQEFLQKPLARLPAESGGAEQLMQQLERLGIRDAFVAVPSWQEGRAVVLGGFRFRSGRADAEKVVDEWRSRVQQAAGDMQVETVQHQRHRIEVLRRGDTSIASVFDDDWFFAASGVAALTQLLDRTSTRAADGETTLASESEFAAALKRMPDSYAGFAFARVEQLLARLTAQTAPDAMNADRLARLRQIRSVSGATEFENGKIRDVLFVAMPKTAELGELKRESLALTTSETFLYLAMMLDFAQLAAPDNPAPLPGAGVGTVVQRVIGAFAQNGVTAAEWQSAFGAELGVIADWPSNARIPALLATLPVNDRDKADQLAVAITAVATEGSRWAISDREGIRYYSQVPENPLIPLAPTVAIGKERAVLGLDTASVQAAMNRGGDGGDSQLNDSAPFKTVENAVQTSGQTFAYVDTALFYRKLDAALRPMLIMGAAFMPSVAQGIDLAKVPPPEVITRHLSPIVVSQTYTDDGYRTESVGPLSIFQAAAGIAVSSAVGASWYSQSVAPKGAAAPASGGQVGAPTPSATP